MKVKGKNIFSNTKEIEERVKRRMKREPFVLSNEHCTFTYIFKNRNKDNIGQIINTGFLNMRWRNLTNQNCIMFLEMWILTLRLFLGKTKKQK